MTASSTILAHRRPPSPILAWRRRIAATVVASGLSVAACLWWAFRAVPPALPIVDLGASSPVAPAQDRTRPALDATAFEVALWNPPPKIDPPAPAVAERVEPLRLQLLGIVHTEGGLRAALYDPQDDRLHLVADGEAIGRIDVVRVTGDVVELADGRRTHVLRIREDDPAGLGGVGGGVREGGRR